MQNFLKVHCPEQYILSRQQYSKCSNLLYRFFVQNLRCGKFLGVHVLWEAWRL